jgi:hypothetical protein
MKTRKFFSLRVFVLLLEHLSGLVTETVEAARAIINMMTGTLLKQRFDVLDASAAHLRSLLNRARANPLTEELRAFDEQMSVKFEIIKHTLTTFVLYTGTPKGAAAKLLLPVFKPFWNVMSRALNDQEADLKEMHNRVAAVGNYLEALTTLDLMDTWLALMALVSEFNATYDRRLDAEAAYKSATDFKTTVVTDYEAFCNVLAVTLATDPTPALELVFGKVDIVRKKYAPPHRRRLDRAHTSADSVADQPYDNGKDVQPFTRVFYKTDDETTELVFTVDFEVSYKNNKKVGDAMMIIHGKGKYVGQFVITFHIVETTKE